MENQVELLWQTRELQDQIVKLDIERWLQYAFITWNWWILLVFLIVPWMIWVRWVDRKRMVQSLLFGMIIMLITMFLDVLGTQMGFWMYPVKLVPVIPKALPFDAGVVPVAYMLIYQYFRTWKSFSIALVCMAFIYAYIGEPLTHWLEQTLYLKWKYTYSFIYYILTGILVRWLVEKVLKAAKSAMNT